MSEPSLRPYRPQDRAAVYDVCVRTGAAGGDARGLFSDDDLLPDVYAGPYLHLEPELALVLDDGAGRAVGYVLGTADTARFVAAWRREWLPRVAARHPLPAPAGAPEREVRLRERLHEPGWMLHPELAGFPAHLHVDLLPQAQGGGHGRALVEAFCAAAARAGAAAVHLGVDPANTRAIGFYERLGFTRLPVPGGSHYGRATAP